MSGYIGSKASVTLVDGYTQAEADAEFVQDPNGAITVSGSNVGIGTSSPSSKLEVAALGALRLQTGSVTMDCTPTAGAEDSFVWNTSLSVPYVWKQAGTERMRIDSLGRVTMPYQPAFDVAYSGSGYGLKNPVIFDVAYSNVGGHYNTSTGRFTAPVSGSYLFYTTFIKNNANGTARRRFEKNDTDPLDGRHLRMDSGTNFGDNGTMQATMYLNAGDYVTVSHTEGGSYGSEEYDYFGGYLIG